MTAILTFRVDTPVGTLCGASRDGALVACGYADHWDHLVARATDRFPADEWRPGPSAAAAAVRAYVDGDLEAIDALAVDAVGTEFQQTVWAALRTIPLGDTWSYQDLAEAIGNIGATRAVGTANGANPVSVVVPCHRVVRADGSLGGYGGGLDRKAWLLAHEGARLA
ncbi:MAG: methylated-DNA--[protein]-cysteine S-methyltransferase [Acidimicrobiales bacterium]|nr:methylated-DNA--[protein]-cysteine S-methyltransferase [Acidimicrobiales bacterium]